MKIEDPINIEGREYLFDELPAEAQKMLRRVMNIDTQLDNCDEQMTLLKITRDGCYKHLIDAVQAGD